VITQVFPDEFHLHTLDQLLAATARLHQNVNTKIIVIGLMDRLSAFASREAETKSPEERKEEEEKSIAALLEKLKLSREAAEKAAAEASEEAQIPNGEDGKPADEGDTDTTSKTVPDESAPPSEENGDVEKTKGIPGNVKLFEVFYEQVVHLVSMQRLPIQDITALLVSLVNLALNISPERLDYVDQVLHFATKEVARFNNSADLHSAQCQANMLALLLGPVKAYCSLFTALALPSFVPLYQQQPYPTRRAVAGEVARSLLRNETKITTSEHFDSVLQILSVLIKEGMQSTSGYPGGGIRRGAAETEETVEEQGWLARIVHLIKGSNNVAQFQLLQKARSAFAEGGERIKYTTPAIITQSLKLARNFKRREHLSNDDFATQSTAFYKFMHSSLSALYTKVTANGVPDLVLRLFVSCGQVACQCDNEDVAYEFFAQAFTVYEESISDSRLQFQAICIIAGALSGCSERFSRENYDTLITKAALHGSKLLKKPDQCRAVYLASHLWWVVEKAERQEGSKEVSHSPMPYCRQVGRQSRY
jgi:vacuolar protein sorting-associated protein 35